jgi:hypothetical protein
MDADGEGVEAFVVADSGEGVHDEDLIGNLVGVSADEFLGLPLAVEPSDSHGN